jgi:hypothetical protein
MLDSPIAFHAILARVTKSIKAGLMLGQAIYWTKTRSAQERDGWFWKTQADWFEEISMGRFEQEKAREILRDLGFISEEMRGNPAKLWFKVELVAVANAIAKHVEEQQSKYAGKPQPKNAGNQQARDAGKPHAKDAGNQQSGLRESSDQDGGKVADKPADIQQTLIEAGITSGTTPETTHTLAASRLVSIWNEFSGSKLPKVKSLTKGRANKIRTRIKSAPEFEATFTAAVKHAAVTPFLCGENERGWTADFDWLIANDTHAVAVLEGKYDAKSGGNSGSNHARAGKNNGAFRSEDAGRFKGREADIIM